MVRWEFEIYFNPRVEGWSLINLKNRPLKWLSLVFYWWPKVKWSTQPKSRGFSNSGSDRFLHHNRKFITISLSFNKKIVYFEIFYLFWVFCEKWVTREIQKLLFLEWEKSRGGFCFFAFCEVGGILRAQWLLFWTNLYVWVIHDDSSSMSTFALLIAVFNFLFSAFSVDSV